jgi:hypothetical protein
MYITSAKIRVDYWFLVDMEPYEEYNQHLNFYNKEKKYTMTQLVQNS